MSTRAPRPRSRTVLRQGTIAALGVSGGAALATVVVTLGRCVDGDGLLGALRSCLVFAVGTALPCAVIVWPLAAWRLRRTATESVQVRCASVAIWSCAVPFIWGVGFAAVVGSGEAGTPVRASLGVSMIAGVVAEMVWLVTLTPVFVYHCTARALRGDPFNGAAKPHDGRDERDEDAEIARAACVPPEEPSGSDA